MSKSSDIKSIINFKKTEFQDFVEVRVFHESFIQFSALNTLVNYSDKTSLLPVLESIKDE